MPTTPVRRVAVVLAVVVGMALAAGGTGVQARPSGPGGGSGGDASTAVQGNTANGDTANGDTANGDTVTGDPVTTVAEGDSLPTGIPPWLSTHPSGKQGQNFDVTQTTSKPKVTLHLPPISAIVHLYLCFAFAGNARCVDPSGDPSVLKPYGDLGPAGVAVGYGPTWLQSGSDASHAFGELNGIKVQALAFGAIPVTAVVHISQPMGSKYIKPLQLKFAAGISNVPAGTVLPGFSYGPAPTWPGGAGSAAYFPSNVDGPVDVRLSDVEVDKVPVDVGPHCHAPGSRLNLFAPAGWADATKGPQKGKPGEYAGLGQTDFGYLQGNASVSPFTGCHDGVENLDPLITSFISSDNNPTDVTVTSLLTDWCSNGIGNVDCAPYDDSAPADPPATPAAVSPAAVARQAQPNVPTAILKALPPKLRQAVTARQTTTAAAASRASTSH